MKRTLKRELKVLEIAKREALETSDMSRQSVGAPLVGASRWKLALRQRKGGSGFMMRCESRSIRTVGEGGEKGRRAISVIFLSLYLGLDGGSNGAPLAAWSGVSMVLSACIAMLSWWRTAILGVVILCAITILYEMVFIDPS